MAESAIDVLKAEIQALLRQQEEVGSAIQEKRRLLRRLEIELGVLRKVLDRLEANPLSPPLPPSANGAEEGFPKPSQAVVNFLRAHPGTQAGKVVAMLEDKIDTKSADRKNLLTSIIRQLQQRGAIQRTVDGRLFIKGEASHEMAEEENGSG
jgi:hypothetical protein